MRPVTILTPRLLLRPARPEDGPAFVAAASENFADPFFWFDAKIERPIWQAQYLETRRREFLSGEDFSFFVFARDNGRLLGGGGLHPSDFTQGRFGMSYWVRRSASGTGIASEAGNSLLRFAFGQLRARSVGLGYVAGNEGSRRVMQRLGFARYARESHYSLPDGRTVDAEIFRRTGVAGLPPLEVSWGFETENPETA